LKKHYVVVGLGIAVVVAVTIVAVGTGAGTDTSSGSTGDASLPPGHPAVSPSPTSGATTATSPGKSLRKTISRLESSHKKRPNNRSVLLKLGDAYFLGQRYTAAANAYQEALDLKPGDSTATVRLAMVWHAEGQSQQALKAIKAVIAEEPNDQEAHYSLAIIYFSIDRVSSARDEWATAAKLDPTSTIGRRSQSFVDLLDGNQAAKSGNGE
jgi:tetratricopeptide (TPR) repeat protein